MTNDRKKTELLVGTFLLLGLVLLSALIVQFGRFGERFHDSYNMTLIVDDAAGIIKGSEVRMGGAKIGRVTRLPVLNEDATVQIDLSINKQISIPEGSSLGVASASLLGDKMIIVTPPKKLTGRSMQANSVIQGSGPSGLDAIQTNAESLSRDAGELMAGATKTLANVDQAVVEIRQASVELREAIEKVNDSILKQQNLDAIDQSLANFRSTTEHWNAFSAELPATLGEARRAIGSMEQAAKSAHQTLTKVDQRVEELAPAFVELPKATAAISAAALKASETMDHVAEGKGLLGTLANDDEVSTDAKAFIRNLKERGILRYQDGESLHPADDPRNRFRGRRR
jgi:phospholipid/cholesterol/gamma-HCH transport system substrate-binding protein